MTLNDWTLALKETGYEFARFLKKRGLCCSVTVISEYCVELSNSVVLRLYTNRKGNKRMVLPSFLSEEKSEWLLFRWEEFNGRNYDGVHLFVDGSFMDNKVGYGVLVITENQIEKRINGCLRENLEMKNVTGEIEGVIRALEYCMRKGYRKATIHYDYMGLRSWAEGEWKAKYKLTRKYVERLKQFSSQIDIEWVKARSHIGETFNEIADKLAKKAVEDCG
ncbi:MULTISPECIES: RNase H family protein [Mesotoga]|jgi:ribonuclease HI|uniref:RNase H family protein n=1 Tax=Mesotoga TaxID=1184396 RepID=UPI001BD300A1|nr:RNase H family protein [Mesotoga prima]HNQ70113.1 reverse transcriptase-like protein [Mesotoga prima]HNS74848.1 reverse transcriptase-like protein [Mesotoga prima]HPE52483.1 reverse transcriptase-like protein [Mesotoga prima]HQC15612.1 reverse transcriptase-like protein [Mesotoga prima]